MKKKIQLLKELPKLVFVIGAFFAFVCFFLFSLFSYPVKAGLDLETDPVNILDYRTIKEHDKDVVEYYYKTDKKVDNEPIYLEDKIIEEDLSKRTDNIKFYPLENKTKIAKVYSGKPFYNDNGVWYETQTATTTITAWEILTKETTINRIVKYFIPPATAEIYFPSVDTSTYYSTGYFGSGVIWDTYQSESGTGVYAGGTQTYLAFLEADSTTDKWRILVRNQNNYDTSDLPDELQISEASLFFYGVNKWDNLSISPTINAFGTTATYTDTVVASDHQLCLNTPLATGISYAGFNKAGYNELVLNENGINNIDPEGYTYFCIREADFDAPNIEPSWSSSAYSGFHGYMSEETGTDKDPYLQITYTEGGGSEEKATSTIGLYYPENMCINNDLSIICGMTQHYESTTSTPDWVEYHYYHIPFFIWIIVFIIIYYIADRIYTEILIRLRK